MNNKSAVHSFIAEERSKGVGDQEIRHKLLDGGWHIDIVNNAMGGTQVTGQPKPFIAAVPEQSWRKRLLSPVSFGVAFLVLVLLALFI